MLPLHGLSCAYIECSHASAELYAVNQSQKLNVRKPAAADLAKSLPSSWKGFCAPYTDDSGLTHPPYSWLQRLWSLVGSVWFTLPSELDEYLLVPISAGRLACPAWCGSALTTSHQSSMPADAAELLTATHCFCIKAKYADRASKLPTYQPPILSITTALSAAAEQTGLPLAVVISAPYLGPEKFEGLCRLLASLSTQQTLRQAWSVLKQCCIFEDLTGVLTDLCCPHTLRLLPNAAWEKRLAGASDLLLWKPLCYHTASDAQRKLLQMAGLPLPSLLEFLEESLLPDIQGSTDVRAEALMLHALDDLALHVSHFPAQPQLICIEGQRVAVGRLVDSSIPLLKTLFEYKSAGKQNSKHGLHDNFCLWSAIKCHVSHPNDQMISHAWEQEDRSVLHSRLKLHYT